MTKDKKYQNRRFFAFGKNDFDFANYILNYGNVAIVPGVAFGKSPFFRLSYATSLEKLKQACNQIEQCLYKLK